MLVALSPNYEIAAVVMSFFLSFWNLFSVFLIPRTVSPIKSTTLIFNIIHISLITSFIPENLDMVEIILLSFSSVVHNIWSSDVTGGRQDGAGSSTGSWRYTAEGLSRRIFGGTNTTSWGLLLARMLRGRFHSVSYLHTVLSASTSKRGDSLFFNLQIYHC